MLTPQPATTIEMKQCHSCGMELRDRDKFCRRCGVRQNFASSIELQHRSECETQLFVSSGAIHQSFSGPLVQAITTGLAHRTTALHTHRWALRLASALVAVPLWLMIVLLSPLEALAAARAISNQH